MSNFPISYPYKPKKWLSLFIFLFFTFAAYFSVTDALENNREVILNIYSLFNISFTVFQETLFHWALAVMSGFMSFMGIVALYNACTSKAEVILTHKDISIPISRFNSSKNVIVPFNEILSFKVQKLLNIRSLKIIHKKGKVFIASTNLPKEEIFDEILSILHNNLNKS